MRRAPALCLLCLASLAAACGESHVDGPGTTAARPTTTSPASTSVPTTTITPVRCAGAPMPAGATDLSSAAGDIDGDGTPDTVRSYRLSASGWHLNVKFARGGGADVGIATVDGSFVGVLGGADVDGDGAEELWARTGQGASATIVGLARLVGCDLVRVTAAAGDPAGLPVGGSVGTASGVECEARVDVSAHLTTYTASNVGNDRYEVRATEYALDGTVLMARGSRTTEATLGDRTFMRATSFTCGQLSL